MIIEPRNTRTPGLRSWKSNNLAIRATPSVIRSSYLYIIVSERIEILKGVLLLWSSLNLAVRRTRSFFVRDLRREVMRKRNVEWGYEEKKWEVRLWGEGMWSEVMRRRNEEWGCEEKKWGVRLWGEGMWKHLNELRCGWQIMKPSASPFSLVFIYPTSVSNTYFGYCLVTTTLLYSFSELLPSYYQSTNYKLPDIRGPRPYYHCYSRL